MCIIRRPQHRHQRVEQPVLVARHQITKRMRLAAQAIGDEFLVWFRHVES
jgi:hypothetical protein